MEASSDPPKSAGFWHLLEWWAVAFRDRYRHLRAINKTDQEYRGIQLRILDDAIF
jgi:hypothetical protein